VTNGGIILLSIICLLHVTDKVEDLYIYYFHVTGVDSYYGAWLSVCLPVCLSCMGCLEDRQG